MNKQIALTQGHIAIVDPADFEWLSQWKWSYTTGSNGKGARAERSFRINGRQKHIFMHRLIMDAPDGMEVDHINGNGLDNQRKNLRLCSRSQNAKNITSMRVHTSWFKGVSYHKRLRKWHAQITNEYRRIHLGLFACELEAARAYNLAAPKYHGEFASLNDLNKVIHV